MYKNYFICLLFLLQGYLSAQEKKSAQKEQKKLPSFTPNPIQKNQWVDSNDADLLAAEQFYQLPIISAEGLDELMEKQAAMPALLHANKDPFLNFAMFQFSANRYKVRSLPNSGSVSCINGIELMSLLDGNQQWNLFTGLSELTKNAETKLGLGADDLGLDQQGVKQLFDVRPHKMFTQQTIRIRYESKFKQHKITYARSRGFNQSGWAFAFSSALTLNPNLQGTGNLVNGISGTLAIDKRWANHVFTLLFFENVSLTTRQTPIVAELKLLNPAKWYNPYMGMYNGVQRNANLVGTRVPVFILSDDVKLPNQSNLWVSLAWLGGNRFTTGIDYYDAPDPRPDYYKNLPSFQKDSSLQQLVKAQWETNPKVGQLNWEKMININQHSFDSIPEANGKKDLMMRGLRAKYVLEKRMQYQQQVNFQVRWKQQMTANSIFRLGMNFQWQEETRNKQIADLLGADFYVNWNGFAKRDLQNDPASIQNNLDIPNEILKVYDLYGYHYKMQAIQTRYWAQYHQSLQVLDYFLQSSVTHTSYQRIGLWRNGLFPYESIGPSHKKNFIACSFKAGLTAKLNGKNYLFFAASNVERAPLANDIFLSPKLHNAFTDNVRIEKNQSLELGYYLQKKLIQLRLTAYWSHSIDAIDLISFYHDLYQTLVNMSLSDIGKKQMGIELGTQITLSQLLQCQFGMAIGEAIYTNRQQLQVNADNGMAILERSIVYSKNYRQGGMPQTSAGIGFTYRSAKGKLMINLAGSFFANHWLPMNPIRRTVMAVSNIAISAQLQNEILEQEKLPLQWNVNLGFGYGFSAFQKRKLPGNLHVYLHLQNLLNQQDFISSGYEQLRFDFQHQSTDKFPPKFYYLSGINGSLSLLVRL